jgi:sulfur-oxidizing protein SoxZ
VKLEPAISTNPYFSFYLRAAHGGMLEFEWLDTNGDIYTDAAVLDVD